MSTYHDAHQLAQAQRAAALALRREFKAGHRAMANDLYKEAYRSLSGSVSQKDLDLMGNPYGRKSTPSGTPGRQRHIAGGRSLMPTLPINVQTNKLREALRLTPQDVGTAQVFALSVSQGLAPYAKYILNTSGTVKMVTRPFWAALEKSWKRHNFELLVKIRALQKGV